MNFPVSQQPIMRSNRNLHALIAAATLLMPAAGALAQAQPAQNEYTPKVGQSGKDVIWVPTPQRLVDKMLDMAKVAPGDFVIDLGSGDGVLVIASAKRGARAIGIELNPELIELSKRNADKAGLADKTSFTQGDLFDHDFSQATVITMYLLPDLNLKLRPKILALKPGTRIVSNSWHMGDWQADDTASIVSFKSYIAPFLNEIKSFVPAWLIENMKDYCNLQCVAYLWIVPAKVAGTWRLPHGELALRQRYQMVEGTLNTDGRMAAISGGRLRGDRLSFTAGGAEYSGRVTGGRIEGSVKSGGSTVAWSATLRADNPVSSAKSP